MIYFERSKDQLGDKDIMSSLKDIIGQEQIIKYISNAVAEKTLSHAYILSGEKGSGKRTFANIFSMAIQCQNSDGGVNICGNCQSCKQSVGGNQPDIIRVTHEKPNTISVDDVRSQINGTIDIKPYSSQHKVYIIENAELMTTQAQNALLKNIEEPPEYGVFILLTQNAEMLLPTIRSRCIILKLRNIKDELIYDHLVNKIGIEKEQAKLCVAFAAGNIGRAIQLAESEYFEEIKNQVIDLVTNINHMEISDIAAQAKSISDYKVTIDDFLDLISIWYRDVLVYKATKNIDVVIFKEQIWQIKQKVSTSSYEGIERIIVAIEKSKARLKANVNFDLTMELLLLTMQEN